jgi:hypothetical protein
MAGRRRHTAVQLPEPGQLATGDGSTLDRLGDAQKLGGDGGQPAVPAWYTSAAWAATVASPAMSVRRGWR